MSCPGHSGFMPTFPTVKTVGLLMPRPWALGYGQIGAHNLMTWVKKIPTQAQRTGLNGAPGNTPAATG